MRIYLVSVENVDNSHIHFKRQIELPEDLSFPYETIVSALSFLYPLLKVKIKIEVLSYERNNT